MTLQHLIPPGTAPIPQHLLSSTLAQRHNVLHLEPTDPAYYSWPLPLGLEGTHASDPTQVVQALEAIHESSAFGLEALQDLSFPIRYAPAPPGLPNALVHIPTGHKSEQLVLVFVCDDDDEWKFHDARLFLAGDDSLDSGFATLDEALRYAGIEKEDDDSLDSASSDAYWNGYAASNGSGPPTSQSPTSVHSDEAAYWDRYDRSSMSVSPAPPPSKAQHRPAPSGRSPSAVLARLEAVAAARAAESHSHSHGPPHRHVPPLITSTSEIDLASPAQHTLALSPGTLASPALPPAPCGGGPLTLLPSPTQAAPANLQNSMTPSSGGLKLNLGTPPPSLPTVSAPLPTSPSITSHPVMLVDVKGKGRATANDVSALAINLHPNSAGSEPMSAFSLGSAGSRQSSLSQVLSAHGNHIPSPVSPPSRSGSYPTGAPLQRRGSHPLATSHTFAASGSSAGSSISSLASVHDADRENERDAGLTEAVRGLYHVWRSGRPAGQTNVDEFVAFVAGALGVR